MGACAAKGGAATSGASLTGKQIAHAIRTAVEQQKSDSKPLNTINDIAEEAYRETRRIETKAPAPGAKAGTDTEHATVDMVVSEYAPDAFRFLRHVEGTPDDVFINEWQLSQADLELGEGRSQAMFLKSNNMEFMCKTIAQAEVDVLLGVLKSYTEHLGANPNSLLMRFLMILSVEVNNDVGFILCFSDTFAPCDRLNERWDIKGRVPKPGKYRHFPKLATSQEGGVEASEPVAEEGTPATTDGDEPLKLKTLKDKDLTRLFWLPIDTRQKLIAVLEADFNFLESNGLMDYSLLIGVKYLNEEENEAATAAAATAKKIEESTGSTADGDFNASLNTDSQLSAHRVASMRQSFALGEDKLANVLEMRPPSKTNRTASPQPDEQHELKHSEFHDGIHSVLSAEVYYIAIIDMLTVYNGKKKSANFFKTFLWKPETLSTIPPDAYRTRIQKYSHRLFPKVVEGEDNQPTAVAEPSSAF